MTRKVYVTHVPVSKVDPTYDTALLVLPSGESVRMTPQDAQSLAQRLLHDQDIGFRMLPTEAGG